jgi:type II secretory pathway component PulC
MIIKAIYMGKIEKKIRKCVTFLLVSVVVFILTGNTYVAYSQNETFEVDQAVVEKILSTNTVSLRRIMKDAEKNLERVNSDILRQKNEETAKNLIEEGKQLYKSGQIEEANKIWEKSAKLSNDPAIMEYLEQTRRVEKEKSKIRSQQDPAQN